MLTRYAIVVGSGNVAAYLPAGYEVLATFQPGELDGVLSEYEPYNEHTNLGYSSRFTHTVIGGMDSHGWTLDGYIIPRLASGNYQAVEIGLDHPVMKRVP